jgi:hypothetical protein
MKKVTLKRVRLMKLLLKRHRAIFFIDETDGGLYYTYPKGGWSDQRPTIDGVELEYVSAHDDNTVDTQSGTHQ